MYQKIVKFGLSFLVLFICGSIFSEIINFINITPFVSLFFFFEGVFIYSYFDRDMALHAAFLLGVISDIISLNNVFFFSFGMPLLLFVADSIRYSLKLSRYPVCMFFWFVYSIVMYRIYNVPLMVVGLLLIFTYPFCVLNSYILERINIRKSSDGKEG